MMADLDVAQAPSSDDLEMALGLEGEPVRGPERPRRRRRAARTSPSPRRLAGRRVAKGVALLAVVAGLVAAPVALRQRAEEARVEADAARADAAAAAARRAGVDQQVEARRGALDDAYAAAQDATAARTVQQARLAGLQLTEATLDGVVTEARADSQEREAERQEVDGNVQQNARDLPQLEGCLVEVRSLVDVAFQATVHPEIRVPAISAACRALIAATAHAEAG